MKFGGHETFHLRDNWIHKGLNYLADGKDLSNNDNAIEALGIGNNMVISVRYWLQATGLAYQSTDDGWQISTLGKSLLKYDPYFERLGTAWLIHFNLASNEHEATTWFWFFNKFGVSEFSEDSAAHYLEAFVFGNGRKISPGTLRKDIHTLIRLYAPYSYKVGETPEDNLVSPLVALELMKRTPNGFKLNPPDPESLSPEIFLIALIDFWKRNFPKISEVSFEELASRDGSPFKAFLISGDHAFTLINKVSEKLPRFLSYSKAGGFFSVSLKSQSSSELYRSYFKELDQ